MPWPFIPPGSVIASWPAPNYVNPTTRGPQQYIISAVFGSVAAVAVILRLYTRKFTRRYFGFDDGLILLAFISSIGVMTIVTLCSSKYEWDRHLWDFDLILTSDSLLNLYLARILWSVATTSVRLSILCLYYRLLAQIEAPRHYRWILHGVTVFTIIFMLEIVMIGIVPCVPVQAYWEWQRFLSTGENFTCINDFQHMQAAAVINTCSEFVMAILPWVAVYGVNVAPHQRWNVIGLLSLGFFVALAGIVRSFYLWKMVETYDLTWWAAPHWICAEAEIDIALTCACAAPLAPVLGRFIKRMKQVPQSIKSLPHMSLSMDSSNGGIKDKFQGVSVINDQDRNDWVKQMSRTIDLEGISDDGFGYMVHISGPSRKKTKMQKIFASRPGSNGKKRSGLEVRNFLRAKNSQQFPTPQHNTFCVETSQDSPVNWEDAIQPLPDWDSRDAVQIPMQAR